VIVRKVLAQSVRTSLILSFFFFCPLMQSHAANTIDEFLQAPIWYVDFEVILKAKLDSSSTKGNSTHTVHIFLERKFSANWPIDMRQDGPSMILGMDALSGGGAGTKQTQDDATKMMQDMMARMGTSANWTSTAGALDGDTDAGMKAAMGPATLDYLRVDTSTNVLDEMNMLNDIFVRETRKGSGPVLPGGGQGIIFEIDGPTKKYTLQLPHGFNDMNTSLIHETQTIVDPKSGDPITTNKKEEVGLRLFPGMLDIVDSTNLQGGLVTVKGDVDPSTGKISGERTIAIRYDDKSPLTVPGTLTFKYTLTMTKPAKK
jgi:hypothetical protein